MMKFFYNTAMHLLKSAYFFAAFFHPKAKLFVHGRKKIFKRLKEKIGAGSSPLVWMHCASLGEFEQGRPVIEEIRKQHPQVRILLTFFSPSGYEVQKHYPKADHVDYLPVDTPASARKFVQITKPALAIFVKYEFWVNYTSELARNGTPVVSISSIFRNDQVFFKSWGELFRKMLRQFNHFFVQNNESISLLRMIGISKATLSGDTRFDRVFEITQQAQEIPLVKKFKGDDKVFVVGSCWPEDMDLLGPFINENQYRLKFIIAPHEIKEDFLSSIERSIQVKSLRFSKLTDTTLDDAQVLIIDNVGMLSRLYRYGEFAWIGGGFGKGLHNILEAACYGVPIFFGNRSYQKFKEANDLILRGGAFEVGNFSDLKTTYEMLLTRPENFLLACEVTRQYVRENLGATDKIIKYCGPFLSQA